MRLIVTTYIALLGLFAAVAVHAAPFKAYDNNLVNVRRSGEIITLLESRAEQSPGAPAQIQQSPDDHSKLEEPKTKGGSSKKVQWHPDVKEPTESKYGSKKIIITFTGEAAGFDPKGKPLASSSANAAKAVHEPQAVGVPPQIRTRLNEWAEDHLMRKVPIVYNGKYMLGDTDAGFSFTYRFSGDVQKTEYPASLPPVSHSPPAAAAAAEDSDSSFDYHRKQFSSDSD
ncbi:hypothetical protein F5879DRAFT_1006170 [Lentinula edodes]|nr:hypothetical protein F5879DRAFT_1006170 [Lentinula edodes]